MRAILSILSATLSGSVALQSYLAIWRPSSFGRFAEFPVLLLYAGVIVVSAFCLFVLPGFVWLRRTHRRISLPAAFVAGLLLGGLVMLLFMALHLWPVRVPELIAGGFAGAVGTCTYARLIFKRSAEPCAPPNGGPAASAGNSGIAEGPPSVS